MRTKILVIGGFGFIASGLAERLVKAGHEVTLADSSEYAGSVADRRGLKNHANVCVAPIDITNQAQLNALPKHFTHVLHAASVVGIQKVIKSPVETALVNTVGTANVLAFCRDLPFLARFIYLSTSEVYGSEADGNSEDSDLVLGSDSLRWTYASSKITAEFLVRAYGEQYCIPTTVIRPFNVYGPHRSEGNAMSNFIANAICGRDIEVTGNGTPVRSWCYISDFLDAVSGCFDAHDTVGEIINVGNPSEPITTRMLAQKIIGLTSSKSRINMLNDGAPDIHFRVPNIDKAARLLAYKPIVLLDEGITRTVDSYGSFK